MYETYYLDHNATSFPKNSVYLAYETKLRTSPFSTNIRSGIDPSDLVEDILDKIKILHKVPANCDSELIITRGATEALNIGASSGVLMPFCDPHMHNAIYTVLLKQGQTIQNNIEELTEFNSVIINAASSFGISIDWKPVLAQLYYQVVLIDASQWISWDADITDLLPTNFFANGNQVMICWGFHKHLGMYPNLGVLLHLRPKGLYQRNFNRCIIGGVGNTDINYASSYKYSKVPAGTFNSIDLIAYKEMLSYYIGNPYFLPKIDPDDKRIFDLCFQFLKEADAESDVEYTTRGVTASFWHQELELGELTMRLNDYLNDLEPEAEVIYRVGKFCCNYYFDKVLTKDAGNERQGRIRLSL